MKETEFLKKYNDLLREVYYMEFRIKFCQNSAEKEELESETLKLKDQITQVENDLIQTPDKSSSNHSKQRLIDQLNQYIIQINKAKYGLKLSRKQGLVLENHLFSIIMHDLYYIVMCGLDLVHIPSNLYYTTDDNDGVEIAELTEFFKKEREILQSLQPHNYVALRRYFEDFKKHIFERFIS